MKLRFKHSDSITYPCAAIIDRDNEPAWICAVGRTWAEAEAEAIAKAKAQLDAGPPPEQKTIEI